MKALHTRLERLEAARKPSVPDPHEACIVIFNPSEPLPELPTRPAAGALFLIPHNGREPVPA